MAKTGKKAARNTPPPEKLKTFEMLSINTTRPSASLASSGGGASHSYESGQHV